MAVGDRVMGLLGLVGSEAVVDARLVTMVPAGWSLVEAAAVPVAFLTAFYGLSVLAEVAAGQKVLVHAGTGGLVWQRCRWRGIGVQRFSSRRVAPSGIHCGRWVLTISISPTRDRWSSRRRFCGPPRAAVWT